MTFIIAVYLAIGAFIVGAVLFDDVRTGWLPLSDAGTLRFWLTLACYATMIFLWPVAIVIALRQKDGRK